MAKIALLIGVSEYGTGLNPLPGSALDVDAMQRVLVHPDMGGFAATDIKVLKNPQRQAMVEATYWLFNDRQKDDLLLFYFSGHGIKDEYANYYLATRETRKQENGKLYEPSAVGSTDLHKWMQTSRSQYQVIILDACFSGAFPQGLPAKDAGIVNLQASLGGKGRAILTSSSSIEYSFSAEVISFEENTLSVYTRYLVEGIETGAADTDGDGEISVEELHNYASNRVREAAPAMTPEFYPVKEGYRILLAKSPEDDPKLRYRKKVQLKAAQGQGKFDKFVRDTLKGNRKDWGISPEDAQAIENEVLQPYREYEEKLDRYEQTLTEAVKSEYPFSALAQSNLKEYQQYLALRESDINEIAVRVLAPVQAKYEEQQAAKRQQKEELERQRQADLEQKQAEAQENQQPTETSSEMPTLNEPKPVRSEFWLIKLWLIWARTTFLGSEFRLIRFWLIWVPTTFLGIILCVLEFICVAAAYNPYNPQVTVVNDKASFIVNLVGGFSVGDPWVSNDKFGWVAFFIIAPTIGLLQWLVVRRKISNSLWWLLVMSVCGGIGLTLVAIIALVAKPYGSTVGPILFAVITGYMVLLFLPKPKNQHME